jgi:hypothetical protein
MTRKEKHPRSPQSAGTARQNVKVAEGACLDFYANARLNRDRPDLAGNTADPPARQTGEFYFAISGEIPRAIDTRCRGCLRV